ncbi:TIR-like protein FxsC [Streptomyces sp. NBC_01314]|uniref:TIR-like protein FxsC n=1 Tax=Streptomyces sp. NBC_01314 TaxID=2903821 RepID=UPI0030884AAB|nr:TIR-like protein FxsC [Streptomyces sp. NBC_01314]
MPERGSSALEPLARVVAALSAAAPGLDGTALAEALWLASLMDVDSEADGGPAGDRPAETTPTSGTATEDLEPQLADPLHDLHEHLAGAPVTIRGDAVAPAHAPGLPRALEVTRALRPWKRRWPRGRRSVLDVDATVDSYARSGELIPVLSPAPERWFDLVLVVDRSPAMGVWRETVMDFTAVLDRLGAFRTLHLRELHFRDDGFELRDKQGRLTAPRQLRSPDGRRLIVVVSDCAAPGWRDTAVWRQLRDWALLAPVALLNPLPAKLWRRTGLDLPSTRVTATAPGSPNSRLLFPSPLLPHESDDADEGDWLPVPVLSLSPHSLNHWSRTLMRAAPVGAAAVLVPSGGRMERRPRQRSGGVAAEGFLRTASPPAARLAVLCSTFDRLSTRLLHLIRQELVPEATVADVAELLTSGLFALSHDDNGVVVMSPPDVIQRRLQRELAEHEVWRINRALSRHVASMDSWGGRLPAVVSSSGGRVELPAAGQAFGQLSGRTLELLGLPIGGPAVPGSGGGAEGVPRPGTLRPRLRKAPAPADNPPYFFLSYARTPSLGLNSGDPNHWVQVLFQDLCDHIMALTDLPAGASAGFMDREMRSGGGWTDKVSENLAACRVFVPLYSPRYFTGEMQGREWYAFNERIVLARSTGAGDVPAIVPALWVHVPFDQLPESARDFQIDTSLGDRYLTSGIYGLIKLNRLRDEYEEVVYGLARRIVWAAERTPLPPGEPRAYESTPSAFKPRGEGPRSIHLIVAAPTRTSVPENRDIRPYGEDAWHWNPYHGESTRPLVGLVEEMIRSLDYRVSVSDFDDTDPSIDVLAEHGEHDPRSAGEMAWSSRPTILLLDRWAVQDSERRRRLQAFDRLAHPWVSVMVPWSRFDPQCQAQEGLKRKAELERVLPNLLARGRNTDLHTAADGVPTLKAFTDVLPLVVATATQQFLRHASVAVPRSPRLPRLMPERADSGSLEDEV